MYLITAVVVEQKSQGRVSFTTDVWSDGDLKAFMAITTHCIVREGHKLLFHLQLGALRYIRGRHTGERLAEVFLQVLKELCVLDKVCCRSVVALTYRSDNVLNLCRSA